MPPESKDAPKKYRKRKDVHGEPEAELHHDESNWLVSYADMMTLLFGFFVLMYSFSKIDKDKFKVVRKEVSTYFGGEVTEDDVIQDVKKEMKQLMGASDVDTGDFKVYVGEQRLILRLNNELLFSSGSAELRASFQPVIQKMFKSLFAKKKIDSVIVEGHTDGVPMKSFIYPSNWELSSARGARLVREFGKLGISNEKMVVEGYGDSRPLVPNKDKDGKWIPENLKKNRRVLIRVDFGDNKEEADKGIQNKEFAPPKKVSVKKSKAQKKRRRKPSSKAKSQAGAGGAATMPKKADPEALDSLKDRLLKTQKRYKEVQQKAREAQKKRAEKQKLLQKIEQLERQTQKLQGAGDSETDNTAVDEDAQ